MAVSSLLGSGDVGSVYPRDLGGSSSDLTNFPMSHESEVYPGMAFVGVPSNILSCRSFYFRSGQSGSSSLSFTILKLGALP